MAVRVKSNVKFHHTSFLFPAVMRIIWTAQFTADDGYEVTITSGCDGQHKEGSKHYTGRAFDFRTRDYPGDLEKWVTRMKHTLGDLYFVLLERTHIHVQYNA
jgi:hypothetical protein